ncbi:DUF4435 domain-containing protein [uncultured Abiotrophia sp.]|uniref:DUF4435 domain-containing protein n=1 Tax=uncultured Abiotrophia sp. TaxID=316094 RepID=UPI0028E5D66E|nr:DUF4435 domain-containing protein [uncultured Abiotrophia sp.]
MSAELVYSQEGLANRSIFYSKLAINIFVEDNEKDYLYEEILKRLLMDEYKIDTVFPLGGKNRVLSEYIKRGEVSKDGTPNLFLVDGDFDRYIGYSLTARNDFKGDKESDEEVSQFVKNKIIQSDSVLYLETYNIENYFIDEEAVLKYIKGIIEKKDSDLKSIADFGHWRETVVNESKDLFVIYCFIIKYLYLYGYKVNEQLSKLSEKTVSRSSFEFLDVKTGFKKTGDPDVYKEFENKIKQELNAERPSMDLDEELSKIRNEYMAINGEDYFNLICGKFLLDSLSKYVTSICKKNRKDGKDKFDYTQFKWHLVLNFDITKLNYMKDRIDVLCKLDASF